MSKRVLLHCCCAPCSAAILEWLLANGYEPVLFFYNPNIFPQQEYLLRKGELVRYAESLSVPYIDESSLDSNDWDMRHYQWLDSVSGWADEPERGRRCLECFSYRLNATARYAAANGFPLFTTTLASSRWKSIDQIFQAGFHAQEVYGGGVTEFWDKNWRKGGLYERRNILAKQFYNQTYCGCEFSMRRK